MKNPRILLRSSWQDVNIGDIAHTPGVLAIIEKNIPEAEVILWASNTLTDGARDMMQRRFPSLKIVMGDIDEDGKATTGELRDALDWCEFLLHGSGASLVAIRQVKAFDRFYGKPFGVFGITYGGKSEIEVLNRAVFVYFRDSVSLEKAKKDGLSCPITEFGPDGAFGMDIVDSKKAEAFIRKNGLCDEKFLCCIPRMRYTPYWDIYGKNYSEERDKRNIEMKEHDHIPLRNAVIEVVRNTDMKVLLCPEDCSHMALAKEMIYDRLPDDVKCRVVWRKDFWLPDEAVGVYIRSAGLFGNEMHSPIMCIASGIPAIVCRFAEQTTKGFMWRDIGLSEWLFDHDNEFEMAKLVPTVLEMANDTARAKEKALRARDFVASKQKEMCSVLAAFKNCR